MTDAPAETDAAKSDSSGNAAAEAPALTDTRGRARSKASQERGWATVFDKARKLVKQRPDDHLSSILANLRELNISRADPGRYYRVKDFVRPMGAAIMEKSNLSIDDPFLHPDVRNSEYTVTSISTIRYLSKLIRADTSGVMEIGSGWGSNVFQLYLAHGATRSKKIIYYGGEYTREGQACSKFLGKVDPLMNFRAFYFDYRNPDVSFLVRQKGHILLFTSHSIEQVDLISSDLFRQLQEIPNPVTVVHFEPVGWQRVPELMARREANDSDFFEAIGQRALEGDISSVNENSAWWSWRLEYNRNLLPILTRLEDEGVIKMINRAYDFTAAANVLNPSTLLHYEFVR